MLVLLHAGMNKTGSSAVQAYLAQHRSALREAGLVYPDLGHTSHWRLSAAVNPRPRAGYIGRRLARDDQPSDDDVVDRLRDELRHGPAGGAIILSHESFSSRGSSRERLAAFLRPLIGAEPEFRVIAYAREPLGLFVSEVQHKLKVQAGALPSPAGWVSSHGGRAAALRREFGDALTLRAYARDLLHEGDIIADFRLWAGGVSTRTLPAPAAPIEANAAFGGAACAILALWADERGDAPKAAFGRLKRLLAEAERKRGRSSRLTLPDGMRPPLLAANGPAWNALVADLDHDPALKARLRLDAPDGGGIEVGDMRAWLNSCFDPGLVEDALALAGRGPADEAAALLLAWLGSVRERLRSGELG